MKQFIQSLPKVELHLHIEGTLEPELMFELALRNNIKLPFNSIDDVKKAYNFHNLQSFLDIYFQGTAVLLNEQDFFDLTWAYLLRCKSDNVLHTEIMFDPQAHTLRGVSFETVINGIHQARLKGLRELGISSRLIMCFLRHLDEQSAFDTLQQAESHKGKISAVGLDSTEIGHPAAKFEGVFKAAITQGYLTVAHAGEEGPASNIQDALDLLNITRIDHGVRCSDDPELIKKLAAQQIPLTVCPLSNIKLNVFKKMQEHNIVNLLRQELCVTINSDDPAYFGGYMTDNFLAINDAFHLTKIEVTQFTLNAIEASFISESSKNKLRELTRLYLHTHL